MIKSKETFSRTFAKLLTWKVLANTSQFIALYMFTGSWQAGAFLVGWAFTINAVLYFLHERGWAHFQMGYKDLMTSEEYDKAVEHLHDLWKACGITWAEYQKALDDLKKKHTN